MKIFLFILFLVLLFNSTAQNYQPFNSEQPKRFESIIPDTNVYYFSSIGNDTIGDVISMEQYLTLSNQFLDSVAIECVGWAEYYLKMDTTWLNRNIVWNSSQNILTLQNRYNENLNFNFGTSLGDSSVFYQSATEKYYLKYESVAAEQFLDSLDSVRTYSISKYDLNDNPLTSSFDDFHIKLSKKYGLGSFIDCKRFPQEEVAVQLVGQYYPILGYYRMTFDELFPWDAGDTIQVRGVTPPLAVSYKTYSITNRIETDDSVFIYFDVNEYVDAYDPSITSGGYNIHYDSPIVYQKGKSITVAPENNVTKFPVFFSMTNNEDYCGAQRKSIKSSKQNCLYCEECDCLSPLESSEAIEKTFVYMEGLGQKSKMFSQMGGNTYFASVIYSNVGGEICGTFSNAGQPELNLNIKIYPNPVQNVLDVSAEIEMESIQIADAFGKQIITSVANGVKSKLNLSSLDTGVYFVNIQFSNGTKSVKKVFKN